MKKIWKLIKWTEKGTKINEFLFEVMVLDAIRAMFCGAGFMNGSTIFALIMFIANPKLKDSFKKTWTWWNSEEFKNGVNEIKKA